MGLDIILKLLLNHFQHKTNIPLFPQNNDQVEKMVQTPKMLLSKSNKRMKSLLSYGSTNAIAPRNEKV